MMRHSFISILLLAIVAPVAGAQNTIDTSYGDEMIRAYFDAQVRQIQSDWLSSVTDLDDWQVQLPDRRQELLEMLGLDPLPSRTDLQATTTGRLEHDEFFVEKLHFQSMPGLYVTGNLYVPKNRDGRLPGILYVCGHGNRTENGVSLGSKTAYQRHAAWYARHGYVALIIDTIQLAEIEGVHHGTHNLERWWWWNRGYTPAGVETWNGIRALDYLESRPEVDPERLAVTGRSGGGAYSWFIAALDDRVKTSVPTAGITDLQDHVVNGIVRSHCDCMYMINSRRWDFPMLSALSAPRPILLANGDVDPIFPLDGVLRVCDRTRQVYALYNELDHLAHVIVHAGHQDTPPLQRSTYEWMHTHLKDQPLESDIPAETLFQPSELTVFDTLPADEINTRIDELFVKAAPVPDMPASSAEWRDIRSDWLDRLRSNTFSGWPTNEQVPHVRAGPIWESDELELRTLDFESQTGVRLRMWLLAHAGVENPMEALITVADGSTWQDWLSVVGAATGDEAVARALIGPGAAAAEWPDPSAERLAELRQRILDGRNVLAVVAPRGVGPTAWTETERGNGIRRSFMLLGQTHEGMQAWDIRQAVGALRAQEDFARLPIAVEARGVMSGIALYAALFAPGISRLELHRLPDTHRNGPILLNVRKILDVPQAVAAALDAVESIHLFDTVEGNWQWPVDLQNQGHSSGSLHRHAGEGSPWLKMQ